jgi:hypothetical protein
MLAGHVGAGLALGRCARRVNVGFLIFGALLLDLVLWALVLAGVESATAPADYTRRHYFVFDFPYSHGLAAALGWSALAACVTWLATRSWPSGRGRAVSVVVAAVFSHWILDALVHGAGLPLLGPDSPLVGLGLWDHLGIALVLESAIAIGGLVLHLTGAGLSRGRAVGLSVMVAAVVGMTVLGMTLAPAPADMRQPAWVSLAAVPLLSLLGGWLGAGKHPGAET